MNGRAVQRYAGLSSKSEAVRRIARQACGGKAVKFLFLLFALPLLLSIALPFSFAAQPVEIVVYHTNDIHGWIMKRDAKFFKQNPQRPIGGMAVLKNLLAQEKKPFLLLDAGDWFQGTAEGSLTFGDAVIEAMNLLPYTALVVGNHEFDQGAENLKRLISLSRAPVLAANVYEKKNSKRAKFVRSHLLVEAGGARIGIFGLTTSAMPRLSFAKNIEGLEFRPEAEEARALVKKLKAQGASVVIAVTHMGVEEDKILASRVPGLDLIVGGHSHTALIPAYEDPKTKTKVVQAGSNLTRVGRAVLGLDPESKKLQTFHSELLDLWADRYGEDEEVLELVGRHSKKVDEELSVVVGESEGEFSRNYSAESTLGNWMTDCLKDWAKTEISFQNSGGIRSDLDKGPVTLKEIFQIMPFDNFAVTLKLTGNQVLQVLEHAVGGDQGIIQVSGMRFSYDRQAPAGRRIWKVLVQERPLQGERLYSAAAPDFLVEGGDGYSALGRGREIRKSDVLIRDVLSWCVKKSSSVAPPPLGRIEAR